MWDLIVSVPDHCLSFYFSISAFTCGRVSAKRFIQLFGFEIRFCDLKTIKFLKVTTSQNVFDVNNNVLYEEN